MRTHIESKTLLECCGGWTKEFIRSPDPIDRIVRPVHGAPTCFSVAGICASRGWLSKGPVEPDEEFKLCRQRWETSTDRFFAFLRELGISKEDIDRRAEGFSGAVIGWSDPSAWRNGSVDLCQDLLLTLAVLSRTAGAIFLPARPPDYSWQALFQTTLIIDEPLEVEDGHL